MVWICLGVATLALRPRGGEPELAPAERRPELHNVVEQPSGGFMRKAKDALTPDRRPARAR